MSDKITKERVTVSIDIELMKRLREQCQKDKRSLSSVFEMGAENYLKKSSKEKK